MRLPEVTEDDYRRLGGAEPWAEASRSLPAATAAVRYVMGFNAPETEEQAEAFKRAVCAAMAVDAAYGRSGGVGEGAESMSIGSFSVSGGSGAGGEGAYGADMERAVRRELSGTGLLFQGIG